MKSLPMATLNESEKLLSTLSVGEKAQILKWVVQDLGDAFAGIDSRPEVSGCEPCIARTRIPVWLLEQAVDQALLSKRCWLHIHPLQQKTS